jgi:hypothetical protein
MDMRKPPEFEKMLCNDILMDIPSPCAAGIPLSLACHGMDLEGAALARVDDCFYDSNKRLLIK